MPAPKAQIPNGDLFHYEVKDGYEQGGLIYFRFEGEEMVAIIRERSVFDKHRRNSSTVQQYANSLVSGKAYGAAKAVEKLIPEKKLRD